MQNETDLDGGIAAFEAKEFRRAMQLLSPLAEQGDVQAQFRPAIMWQNGLGVVMNEKQTAKFMRLAADQGFALAQHGLGFMYLYGECLNKDPQQARLWLDKGAKQGLEGSMACLATIYEQGLGVEVGLGKANEWYAKAGFGEIREPD